MVNLQNLNVIQQCYIPPQQEGPMKIGESTYGSPVLIEFGEGQAEITIGKYCSIATETKAILGGEHNIKAVTQYPFDVRVGRHRKHSKGDIYIGNDVWIGHGVTILSGVTIGNGAIIGAMAVVSKDIPAYAVAVGNPIKVIKYRFPPEAIEKLEEIQWWDLTQEQLSDVLEELQSQDVWAFINKCREVGIIGPSAELAD